MRWLLILLIAFTGCRRKSKPAPVQPVVAEQAPAAIGEAVGQPSSSAPQNSSAPRPARTRAGHPGEPADPASLRGLPEKYFAQIGSFPNSWQEMINRKYLAAVPMGKNGKPLDFRLYTEWLALPP